MTAEHETVDTARIERLERRLRVLEDTESHPHPEDALRGSLRR